MVYKIFIMEVTLRHAVRATSKEGAEEILREQYTNLADDGSLSDLLVYEWDNPVAVAVEEED